MKHGLAFLLGVACGVSGLTHFMYWLVILVVGVIAWHHGIHLW